ncbi:MAG TPA: translation initiation factor IF-6 [Candidatus Bathyarchaeota archaeon]|nr:translation initiation factor IF-6 [Candidatus Bathyarchaeota archaeon]
MGVYLSGMFGSACIGVYILAIDRLVLTPKQMPKHKAGRMGEWLEAEVVQTNVGGSILLGSLLCGNSNGIVAPHYIREEEIRTIESALDINVVAMESRRTAYGNLVLANDKGALASPELTRRELEAISDALGVEVVQGTIAGLPYVGSLATATNRGVLAHPKIGRDELELLRSVLKVPVDVGTVNGGIPYIATGLVANSHGAVAGYATTGREMAVIGQAFGVL